MTVFLPREGKTIDEVLGQMSGTNWKLPQYDTDLVDLKLPRIKTSTNFPLIDIMTELGMPSAFDYSAAEFPYFCNENVFISGMFQKAAIDLDEEGTEAAAVTVIESVATGEPDEYTFHADRPFFYIISEQSTGVIFFIGQYTGPGTASSIRPIPNLFRNGREIYNLAGQRLSKMQKGINIIDGKKILK